MTQNQNKDITKPIKDRENQSNYTLKEETPSSAKYDKETTAARIKQLRGDKGYSLEKVAYAVGYGNAASISKIENTQSSPSLDKLCKLSDFFGVSTDYLLGLTDQNMSSYNEDTTSYEKEMVSDQYKHFFEITLLNVLKNIPKEMIQSLLSRIDEE